MKVHTLATWHSVVCFQLISQTSYSPLLSYWPPSIPQAHNSCFHLRALTVVSLSLLGTLTLAHSHFQVDFTSLRCILNLFKYCNLLPVASCLPSSFYTYMFSLFFLYSIYDFLIFPWITHFIRFNDCCLSWSAEYNPLKRRYLHHCCYLIYPR